MSEPESPGGAGGWQTPDEWSEEGSAKAAAPEAEAPKKPSGLIAALAAVLPTFFASFSCALFTLAVPSTVHSIEEMGTLSAFGIMGATGVAILALTVLLFLSARGLRIPSALHLGLASLPWLVGLAATLYSMSLVEGALEAVNAVDAPTMMARGISISFRARFLGSLLSSGLLAATSLGLVIGALNQRAPRRRFLIGLAVGAVSLPLVGLSFYSVLSAGPGGFALGLSALAMLGIPALGAAAAGDDPKGRSGALGAAGVLAGGLAVLAAAVAGYTAAVSNVFGALAGADPSSLGSLLAHAASELEPIDRAADFALPLTLLVAAAVAGWAASRSKPGTGRLIRASVATVFALTLAGGDRLVWSSTTGVLASVDAPAWSQQEGFEPIAIDAIDRTRLADGLVMAEGLFDTEGGRLSSLEAGPLTAALSELSRTRRRRAPPSFGEYEEGLPDMSDEDRPRGPRATWDDAAHQPLEFALDAGLPATAVRVFLQAAEEAGVRSIVLLGVGPDSIDAEAVERVGDTLPGLESLAVDRGSVRVRIAPPAVVADRDPRLAHARIGAAPPATLSTRPGAPGDAESLSLEPSTGLLDRVDDELAYLAIADDATAESVAVTAARAARRGYTPVLIPGELPGHPDAALAPEPSLADLVAGAPRGGNNFESHRAASGRRQEGRAQLGEALVRGSLSREIIHRVVRRHLNEVRFCYEQGLTAQPDLRGRVTVRFIISGTGAVQAAAVSESRIDNPRVESCITQAVRRWTFPAPDGGGIVVVSYPFILEPT